MSSGKLKKSNRLVKAELQNNEKMPHFDHFPHPGEIDPNVFQISNIPVRPVRPVRPGFDQI